MNTQHHSFHQYHQQHPAPFLTVLSPSLNRPTIASSTHTNASSSNSTRKKLKKFAFKSTKKVSKELLKPFIESSTSNTTTSSNTTSCSSNSENLTSNASNLNYSTLSKQLFHNTPCNYYHHCNLNMSPQQQQQNAANIPSSYYQTNFHKVALICNNVVNGTNPNGSDISSPQLIRIVNLNQSDLNSCLNLVTSPILTPQQIHLIDTANHYENHLIHNYQAKDNINSDGEKRSKALDSAEQIYELIDENTSFNFIDATTGCSSATNHIPIKNASSSVKRNCPNTNPNHVKTFKPV